MASQSDKLAEKMADTTLEETKAEEAAADAAAAATPEDDQFANLPMPPADKPKEELTVDERLALCLSVGQECIKPTELRMLLEKKPEIRAYDGFEPSGRMHIAQGLMKSINVNKLTRAGVKFVFWVADWFAMLNNKMGGDLKKIRKVGEYMIEVWKACGMDMDNVEFLWSSEEINKRSDEYWTLVMNISRYFNISRVKRCGQIMGRSEGDKQPAAQIMYPCMQCADVFFLKVDIAQLGMDQRKVNMLAREFCDSNKKKYRFKPVILSHPMLMGLKEGQEKMSKSDPDSAIFMEDSPADVKRKIKKAYCVPQDVETNPILNYTEHIIFAARGEFTVEREDGSEHTYKAYEELKSDYAEGKVHPSKLKPAVTVVINELIEPVRQHFAKGPAAQLLKQVRKYKTTR